MQYVRFVKWPTQSGLAISRKCCFPHGYSSQKRANLPILWSPNEDFGRRNKRSNADFRLTLQWFFAQIECSHQRIMASKTRISSFVTLSKLFVWVGCINSDALLLWSTAVVAESLILYFQC